MKRALLLIVVPALLIALGFAQTPPASSTPDQATVKGCLGGSDGNYTVVEDKTGHTFKITANSVDLKAHVGHDVALTVIRASGANPATADSTFAVTEVNMISEHCAAPAGVPAATISTLPETGVTPPDAAAIPAATASTPAVIPTPPAEIVVTPPAAAATPAAAVITPAEIASTPPAPAARSTRLPPPPQRRPATPVAAAKPAVTASKSSELVNPSDAATTTPAATASPSPETEGTPAAAAIPPAAPARRGSLWLLIAFAVVIIVLGILAPSISRWRKQRRLEQAGAQNLSFTRGASSDQSKSDPGAGKAA